MKPYKCPICLGTGNVCGGFYNCCPGGTPTSANTMEKCRSCISGIIYGEENGLKEGYTPEETESIYQFGDEEDNISVLKDIREILKQILNNQEKHV